MMARIPGVPEEAASADVRTVYESTRRKYGAVPVPVTLVAHHPEVFRAYTSFEGAFARAARVHARLTALAAVKAAALVGFDDGQLVELTAAVTWENYRERFDHALGVEAQGFSQGAHCGMPEPAAEEGRQR